MQEFKTEWIPEAFRPWVLETSKRTKLPIDDIFAALMSHMNRVLAKKFAVKVGDEIIELGETDGQPLLPHSKKAAKEVKKAFPY